MGRANSYLGYSEVSEKEFSALWLTKISDHFHIEEQVCGRHLSGSKVIIDAIIKPKEPNEWKNQSIAFGLEFKSPTKIDRLNSQVGFMKQCVDYSYSQFRGYGFIPILACPGFDLDSTYSSKESLVALRHFLNKFNVGELRTTYRGLSIIFADSHYIWCDGRVNEGNRWSFIKHFGH